MYLGNSEMDEEFTYLLPLLEIHRKRAATEGDVQLAKRVEQLDSLPKILLVNQKTPYGFPESASRLVSHGGYKIVYTHVADDSYALVLRDIHGNNKDEAGRPIPFLMIVVADNVQDARKLATIAAFWGNHTSSVSEKIASMILYDSNVNGIKFCLRQFNDFIEDCTNRQDYIEITSNRVAVATRSNTVGALLMPSNLYKKHIAEELGLYGKRIKHIPLERVLPLDDPKRAAQMREKAYNRMLSGRRKLLYTVIIGIIIIGIVILLLSIFK